MPRGIGRSSTSGANTLVGAAGSRSLRTYFLYVIATTTVAAGRRSSTSRVSTPMHSNASGSRSTSGGTISKATRGSSGGSGLRTGFLRVRAATSHRAGDLT